MRRALHYVPPAVLSAIVFPELLLHEGGWNLQLTNIRLIAGLIAILTAWVSRNTLMTILVGMAALLFLGWM
jgi:branched-subunit amino acid transport protein